MSNFELHRVPQNNVPVSHEKVPKSCLSLMLYPNITLSFGKVEIFYGKLEHFFGTPDKSITNMLFRIVLVTLLRE